MYPILTCFCYPLQVQTLGTADTPSKEFQKMLKVFIILQVYSKLEEAKRPRQRTVKFSVAKYLFINVRTHQDKCQLQSQHKCIKMKHKKQHKLQNKYVNCCFNSFMSYHPITLYFIAAYACVDSATLSNLNNKIPAVH